MAAKVGGGKKGKYDLGQNSDINVTPFVDILLVLLIIFMVAIPMATVAIKVDLPPVTKPAEELKEKPKFISIEDGGHIYLSGIPTDLKNLAGVLQANGLTPDKSVMITAAGNVTYEEFMGVLNQLATDGYYKVGLISEDTATLRD
jgi:biopolymer transport protein ExbD